MRAIGFLGSVGLLIVAIHLFAVREGRSVEANQAVVKVNASDIPKKVKLIGRLGVSLGEHVVTIRGKWKKLAQGTKEFDFVFVVASIDGKAIQTPIEIPSSCFAPVMPHGDIVVESDGTRKWILGWKAKERVPEAFDGDEWEMLGSEEGHTEGIPRGMPKDINKIYIGIQGRYLGGTFVTEFRFLTARIFGKAHDKSETGTGTPMGPD